MNDEQRAAATRAISEEMAAIITARVLELGGDLGDVLSIGVGASTRTAVGFAAVRATSADAASALVRCTAEAAAKELYA